MERVKNVHLIGIGGCGVSGLAKVLCQMGYEVSGSDLKESATTIRLRDLGIKVFIGHEASHVRFADLIVFSSAVPEKNVELEEAKARNIPVYQRAHMLAWIMDQFPKRIAVAGTHGKTTITAMLSHAFSHLGYDPTFLIGAPTEHGEENAHLGKGPLVIAEADESDKSFLLLNPNLEVIANIEADHMENFGTLQKIMQTFRQFTDKLGKGDNLIICGDCENNRLLMENISKEVNTITYGFDSKNLWQAKNLIFSHGTASFEVYKKNELMGEAFLSVPGWQNVLNALVVIVAGELFGCDLNLLLNALRTFSGARRRFQLMGQVNDVLVFDDYAHHPTEIQATLEAAKSGWPERRIVAIFQPHRFSRTLFLRKEFGPAFAKADEVVITDIYSAGEEPIKDINGSVIVDEIKNKSGQKVEYIPKKENISSYLLSILKPGDLVLTMGAGDIYTSAKELLVRLKMQANHE